MYPAVHAMSDPDKAAIIMGCGEVVTYRQLNDRSIQCAHLFDMFASDFFHDSIMTNPALMKRCFIFRL